MRKAISVVTVILIGLFTVGGIAFILGMSITDTARKYESEIKMILPYDAGQNTYKFGLLDEIEYTEYMSDKITVQSLTRSGLFKTISDKNEDKVKSFIDKFTTQADKTYDNFFLGNKIYSPIMLSTADVDVNDCCFVYENKDDYLLFYYDSQSGILYKMKRHKLKYIYDNFIGLREETQ